MNGMDVKDTFIYGLCRYLYHRLTKRHSWRVYHLCPQYSTYGGKTGYWIVSPRMTRRQAKSECISSFFSEINFDPGPHDYGKKEPEYPMIEDSLSHYPIGVNDVAHYHWKYRSALWGK